MDPSAIDRRAHAPGSVIMPLSGSERRREVDRGRPGAGATGVAVPLQEIDTPHGPARAHLEPVPRPAGLVVLGHGAGGGVGAPDLVTAAAAARAAGFSVALVEQPYRVAGRRAPSPARQLDAAWTAVVARLRADIGDDLPLVTGGRSSGARVACRTAEACGAGGVIYLAFPLVPPRRAPATPAASRLPELDAVRAPVLVVQGARDPFGMPPPGPRRRVVSLAGDHRLRGDAAALGAAVRDFLEEVRSPLGA